MSRNWHAYRARWRGTEYACTVEAMPDGLWVHLRSTEPLEGFEEFAPDLHLHLVHVAECDMVAYVTTICHWRGEPCMVHDERDDELLVEYIGGQAPRALELGLERVERGVYRGWVQREELRGMREDTTLLAAPPN